MESAINIQRAVSCRCGTDSQVATAHLSPTSCHPFGTESVLSRHGSSDGCWWWAVGEEEGGGGCLSGEKTCPMLFTPRVWGGGGYGRLCLRPQHFPRMPASLKIKCIDAGGLLSDHHHNRRRAWGEDTSTPVLPLYPHRLHCCTVCFLLSFMCSLFSPDMSPGNSLS